MPQMFQTRLALGYNEFVNSSQTTLPPALKKITGDPISGELSLAQPCHHVLRGADHLHNACSTREARPRRTGRRHDRHAPSSPEWQVTRTPRRKRPRRRHPADQGRRLRAPPQGHRGIRHHLKHELPSPDILSGVFYGSNKPPLRWDLEIVLRSIYVYPET